MSTTHHSATQESKDPSIPASASTQINPLSCSCSCSCTVAGREQRVEREDGGQSSDCFAFALCTFPTHLSSEITCMPFISKSIFSFSRSFNNFALPSSVVSPGAGLWERRHLRPGITLSSQFILLISSSYFLHFVDEISPLTLSRKIKLYLYFYLFFFFFSFFFSVG